MNLFFLFFVKICWKSVWFSLIFNISKKNCWLFATHSFTNSKWRKEKRICLLALLCWILKKRQLHNSCCNCSWGTKAIQMFGMWFKFSKERRINKTHHVLPSRFYKLENIENIFIFKPTKSWNYICINNLCCYFLTILVLKLNQRK